MTYSFEQAARELFNEGTLGLIKRLMGTTYHDLVVKVDNHPAVDRAMVSIIASYRGTNPFTLTQFAVSPLPGCYEVLVSEDAFVHRDYQDKGIGTLMNSYRIDLARSAGAKGLLCTVRADNKAQRKILISNGWKQGPSFVNGDHEVEYWSIRL